MRTVKIKKWIPAIREQIANGILGKEWGTKKGTNCWEDEFTHVGVFHQWANEYEEFENGAVNYTVALVELPDGTIEEVLPQNLKFID